MLKLTLLLILILMLILICYFSGIYYQVRNWRSWERLWDRMMALWKNHIMWVHYEYNKPNSILELRPSHKTHSRCIMGLPESLYRWVGISFEVTISFSLIPQFHEPQGLSLTLPKLCKIPWLIIDCWWLFSMHRHAS